MVDFFIRITAWCFMAVAFYLVIYLIQVIQEQQPRRYASRPAPRRANSALETQLLQMVAGDWKLARRLVYAAKSRQPGRSEDWYWEKAILDLERDRR